MSHITSTSLLDPISAFQAIAEIKDWFHETSEEHTGFDVALPSKWAEHCAGQLYFAEDVNLIRLMLAMPIALPKYAVNELYVLINILNSGTITGKWYYLEDEEGTTLIHRSETYSVENQIECDRLESFIETATTEHDTCYPAVHGLLTAKPRIRVTQDNLVKYVTLTINAEEAAAMTTVHTFGRA